jgi:uncharacterized protein YndB with AHSA1/START domain
MYVTYLASSQGRVWNALLDPDLTARYWGHRNVSSWGVGDRWEHRRVTDGGTDLVGVVLEVDPPRRLTHTWAVAGEEDDPARVSRVTYDLEPGDDTVRLTVTHDDLPADQVTGANASWPFVLSSLKSFLETGRPLPSTR